MVNKPKAIGTGGETGVVRTLHDRLGFPKARRLALAGPNDLGDVELIVGVMAEIKTGKAAKQASLGQIDEWWLDTLREARNYDREQNCTCIPMLIVQRAGYSPDRADYWRTFMSAPLVAQLQIVRGEFVADHNFTVEMTLAKATRLLRGYGYGEPLETP